MYINTHVHLHTYIHTYFYIYKHIYYIRLMGVLGGWKGRGNITADIYIYIYISWSQRVQVAIFGGQRIA